MITRYIYTVKAVTDSKFEDLEFYDTRIDAEATCNRYNALKDAGEPYLENIICFLVGKRILKEHRRPAAHRFHVVRQFFTSAWWHKLLSGEIPHSDYTEDDLPF